MRYRADYLFCEAAQIDPGSDLERNRVESCNAQELLDQPVHPGDLLTKSAKLGIAF